MSSQSSEESDRRKSFFCHSCSNSFLKHPDADFVCPSCQQGFIEELAENIEASQPTEEEPQFFRVLHDMNALLGPLISGSFTNATTSYANDQDASSSGVNAGRRRTGPISFEDILQEILVSITDGANTGRTPMFFNPGDYAWGGQQGLDTIVTQLLNQMDNAGK
ncbi:hypothetical protein ACKWTF_000553 [Chironomus riparius]